MGIGPLCSVDLVVALARASDCNVNRNYLMIPSTKRLLKFYLRPFLSDVAFIPI